MEYRDPQPTAMDRVFKPKPPALVRTETPPREGKWAPFMQDAIAELSNAVGCIPGRPDGLGVEDVARLLQHAEKALGALEKGKARCPSTSKTVQGVIDRLTAIDDMRPEEGDDLYDAALAMGEMLRDQRKILCGIIPGLTEVDQVGPAVIRFIVRNRETLRAIDDDDLADSRVDMLHDRASAALAGMSPCLYGDVQEAYEFFAAIIDTDEPEKIKRTIKAMARHFGNDSEAVKALPMEWRSKKLR